jgi:hypothetical protein
LKIHKYRLSIALYGLLHVHWGLFFTGVNPLAEPPLSIGLAWACWVTSTSVSGMERVGVRHPASGGSVMAPRRQAHDQGSLLNPADCAPQLAIISWVIVTFGDDLWPTIVKNPVGSPHRCS